MSLAWTTVLVAALECATTVRLMGDEGVRAPLVEALVARRVSVAAAGECAALVASVSARSSGVRLELLIGTRQVVREVTGTSMAAVVIESWLRPDLAQPLLTPREAPRAVAAPAPSGPTPASVSSAAVMPGEARRVRPAEAARAVVAVAAGPTAASAAGRPLSSAVLPPTAPEPAPEVVPEPALGVAPEPTRDAPEVPVVRAPDEPPTADSPTPPIPRVAPAPSSSAAADPGDAVPAEATTVSPSPAAATAVDPASSASGLGQPAEVTPPALASVTMPWVRSGPPAAPTGEVDGPPRARADESPLVGAEPSMSGWSFTLAPVLGRDEASAAWGGGQVRAARALDAVVLEARARVAYNEVQATLQSSVSERWLGELLVGAALPLTLVESTLDAELALALGPRLVRVARGAGVATCSLPASCAVVVPDGFAITGLTPAGQASVGLVWHATAHLALELSGSATWAPWASDLARAPDYAAVLPADEQARLALAGEPALILAGALGLRWSGR